MSQYDHLERDALIRLLQRRDAERPLGLVWERDEMEADAALNDDYVALALCGRVFMVGRKKGGRDFMFLRDLGGKLDSAGAFNVEQLQFS